MSSGGGGLAVWGGGLGEEEEREGRSGEDRLRGRGFRVLDLDIVRRACGLRGFCAVSYGRVPLSSEDGGNLRNEIYQLLSESLLVLLFFLYIYSILVP